MSCVTGLTGTTGNKFYTQHTKFNLPKEFGHAIDESQSESKTNRIGAASGHLKEFMDAISHQPSKWEYMEHFHMNHNFGEKIGTNLGQHAKNKTMVKFPLGKKKTSKKGVMGRKLERTSTSTKDVSQIHLSNEPDR